MAMPSINNAQSDISGFSWIFIAKSSKTPDKKPGDAWTKPFHCFIDDGWGRFKYLLSVIVEAFVE